MTHSKGQNSPRSGADKTSLNYQGTYTCPVCRHGQISVLPLMDAFACDFCRHIFTLNLRKQLIQVVDSSQPMSWRWNGRTWKATHRDELDFTLVIWLVGIALILLPPSLIWLSYYTFPPLDDSPWSWFPLAWMGFTFLSHLGLVGWLVAEHYQFPFYVLCKVKLRELMDQR